MTNANQAHAKAFNRLVTRIENAQKAVDAAKETGDENTIKAATYHMECLVAMAKGAYNYTPEPAKVRVIDATVEVGKDYSQSQLDFINGAIDYVVQIMDGSKWNDTFVRQLDATFDVFNRKDHPYTIGRGGSHVWIAHKPLFHEQRRVAIIKFETK